MKKFLFLLVLCPILAWGGELSESIRWHNSAMSSEFEQKMLSGGFQYKKENARFYYSKKDSRAVNKIQEAVLMHHSPENAFWFLKEELYLKVRGRFIQEGVTFSELNSDYGPVLAWDPSERKKARGIIADVGNISF